MSIDNEIYRFIYKHLCPNDIVIDIGAYLGNTSRKICDNIKGKPSNFYLIEACPKNFKIIRRNHPNFKLFHMAISDVNDKITFHIGDHERICGSSQSNSLYREFIESKAWNVKPKKVIVESMTLDNFIHMINIQDIGLLKINCEGGEYKIFKTEPKMLARIKYIYLQLHRKSSVFLTKEMDKSRSRIVEILSKKFDLLIDDLSNEKGHLHTLWRQKT